MSLSKTLRFDLYTMVLLLNRAYGKPILVKSKKLWQFGSFSHGTFLSLIFKGRVYEAFSDAFPSTIRIGKYVYMSDDFVEASAIEKLKFYNRRNGARKESSV